MFGWLKPKRTLQKATPSLSQTPLGQSLHKDSIDLAITPPIPDPELAQLTNIRCYVLILLHLGDINFNQALLILKELETEIYQECSLDICCEKFCDAITEFHQLDIAFDRLIRLFAQRYLETGYQDQAIFSFLLDMMCLVFLGEHKPTEKLKGSVVVTKLLEAFGHDPFGEGASVLYDEAEALSHILKSNYGDEREKFESSDYRAPYLKIKQAVAKTRMEFY